MYKIDKIMNYNGTYRLDGTYPQKMGRIGMITGSLDNDMCMFFYYTDKKGGLGFITSHIKEVRGRLMK